MEPANQFDRKMLQPGQSRANPRHRTQTLAAGRRALELPNNKTSNQNKASKFRTKKKKKQIVDFERGQNIFVPILMTIKNRSQKGKNFCAIVSNK